MLMLLLFCTAFCSKLFTICHLVTIAYILDWFVNNVRLDIRYFHAHSSASQIAQCMVESSLRNPWIGGSNPGGIYSSFSVSYRMNPFSSENCSFCTLKPIFTGTQWFSVVPSYKRKKFLFFPKLDILLLNCENISFVWDFPFEKYSILKIRLNA